MLNDSQAHNISKFLSLVLRHQPEKIGIVLDENGWADVAGLLEKLARHKQPVSLAELEYLVETNNKKRFAFSADHTRIRASQGHSVEVELSYVAQAPPRVLYHGTATRFLAAILAEGLKKGGRHHVHLSADEATARNVGSRHGKPVILKVGAAEMAAQGHAFFQSENGVWLTESVPVTYLVHESAKPE